MTASVTAFISGSVLFHSVSPRNSVDNVRGTEIYIYSCVYTVACLLLLYRELRGYA